MIGEQIGNYIIESELGKGGMGAVYRAHHAVLGRPAALKLLLPQFTATPEFVQRFFNEARAMTSIRHPGIVEIYEFGLTSSGVAFIAMELLGGESLSARMKRRKVSLRNNLATIRQICGALGAAHNLGIIHRDLKPDNVFLIADPEVPGGERVKLLDFGIAKMSQETSGVTSHTRTGVLLGTPKYMAPEQCRGVKVDHRADLYSLGCILYKLIIGRPPFGGEGDGDILAAHIHAIPEPVETLAPETPPEVARLVGRLLAKDPADRPQTTQELVDEIDRLDASCFAGDARDIPYGTAPSVNAADPPSSAPSTTLSRTTPNTQTRNTRRFHRYVTGIVAVGIVGGVALTVGIMRKSQPRPEGIAGGSSAALVLEEVVAPAAGVITAEVIDERSEVSPVGVESDPAGLAGWAGGKAPRGADAAPEIAATVRVTLDSVPRGAHVWLDGAELGVTPYAGALPKVERRVVFTLRRDRFKDHSVEATASADIRASVRLVARTPTTAPVAPPPVSTRTPLGDDDTPNPLSTLAPH